MKREFYITKELYKKYSEASNIRCFAEEQKIKYGFSFRGMLIAPMNFFGDNYLSAFQIVPLFLYRGKIKPLEEKEYLEKVNCGDIKRGYLYRKGIYKGEEVVFVKEIGFKIKTPPLQLNLF